MKNPSFRTDFSGGDGGIRRLLRSFQDFFCRLHAYCSSSSPQVAMTHLSREKSIPLKDFASATAAPLPKKRNRFSGPPMSRFRLQILHRRICLTPKLSRVRIPPTVLYNKKRPRKESFFVGGDGGIRTPETMVWFTRFPVARPRPTRRHLRGRWILYLRQK